MVSDGACRRMKIQPRFAMACEWFDEDNFFSQPSRLEGFLSNGVSCDLIGEAEAVVAARQWSLMYYSHGGGSGDSDDDDCSG